MCRKIKGKRMTKITAEEIIDLMFLPITDSKVVETLDALGIEQPSLDEEYEMEGRIAIIDIDNSGLQFEFEEQEGYDEDGIPSLQTIAFSEEHKVLFPLNLHKSDDYETVIEKIGRKPDFCDNVLDTFKQWVFSYKEKELTYCVQFKNGFKSINTIVVNEFNRESVEASEFIFPCKDLEK
jgi:hypothetical protein